MARRPDSPAAGYVRGLKAHTRVGGSIVYYYKFEFRGEGYHGSTDESSEREAVKFLEALKTDLRNKAKRGEHSRLSLPKLTGIYDDWKEVVRAQFSERHLKSFDSYMRLHIEPLLGDLSLDKITTEKVEKCRSAYLENGGSSGGANALVKTLNTLFGFAIRRKYLVVRPYDISRLRVQRKPRPVLPAQAVQKFLAEIDRSRNPNVSGIVRLMLGLGLRENEALNARWEHLNLRGETYQPPKTRGGKAPVLSVPDWLAEFLKKAKGKKTEGWMFPSEDGEPHRTGFTRKPIDRAGKKVGLVKLTPHRLRATFATMHVEAGTALPKVQRMLGHSEISTTMRYVEDSTAGLREAQAKVAKAMGLGLSSKSAQKSAASRNAKPGKNPGKAKIGKSSKKS